MVDKIMGNKGFNQVGNLNRSSNAGGAQKSSAAKHTDRVDFSSALQNATKAQAVSSTQESARAEKLQALKAQIENGSYKPDLDKVASSILPFLMNEA